MPFHAPATQRSLQNKTVPSLALILTVALFLGGCQLLGKPGLYNTEPEMVQNPCLVLALPATGQYAAISTKIKAGAELARKNLNTRGRQIQIQNINTDAPDWLAHLQALPPQCVLVGGPLQDKKYIEAKSAGLTQQRIFFAFLPNLQQGDEGITAWRFFPSPQDQIDILIRFVTDNLNIHTYGALSPADNYGSRMTTLLENSLRNRNIPLQKAVYSPSTMQAMKAALRPLLNPLTAPDGKTQLPQTSFEALFLPDSWKKVDMATTNLLANGEDRLVLLGTTLWEQGLSGKQIPAAQKYALAIFPGAWNKSNAPAPLNSGNNDFWTALGYDFVNFGAAVGLGVKPDASIITTRAQRGAGAVKALAPIMWATNGIAHQNLHLFQIGANGPQLLNPSSFRQRRTEIAERAALRMQEAAQFEPPAEDEPASEITPESTATPSQDIPEAETPVQPAAAQPARAPVHENLPPQNRPETVPAPQRIPANPEGTLSPIPRPSYKLSLPMRSQQ